MSNVSIMNIPFGFKIRSKADAKYFLEKCMCNGNEYYLKVNSEEAYFLEKDKDGNISISVKRGDLYDMFNPLLEITRTKNFCYKETCTDVVWKLRKYINAKWFNEK